MTLDEFNEYMAENLDRLFAQARGRLRDPNAVEEAVQNAWVRLLEYHENIDASNPHGYVWTVMEHAIDDLGRAIQREQRAGRVDFSPEIAANISDTSSFSSGEIAGLVECEQLVREALADLSDRERQALQLSITSSRAEASAHMGKGYDQTLSRARAKMDECLGQRREVVLRIGLQRLLELLTNGPDSAPTQS